MTHDDYRTFPVQRSVEKEIDRIVGYLSHAIDPANLSRSLRRMNIPAEDRLTLFKNIQRNQRNDQALKAAPKGLKQLMIDLGKDRLRVELPNHSEGWLTDAHSFIGEECVHVCVDGKVYRLTPGEIVKVWTGDDE